MTFLRIKYFNQWRLFVIIIINNKKCWAITEKRQPCFYVVNR